MKVCIPLLLVLLSLFSVPGRAQPRYEEVQPGQKHLFLNETFDFNTGWTVDKNTRFTDGKLLLRKGRATRMVELDFTKSFEIETVVASNYADGSFEIKLGSFVVYTREKFISQHAIKTVNACRIAEEGGGDMYSGANIEAVNLRKGEFSKYTIRKVDNFYHVFINEQFVLTGYVPPFMEIGFDSKWTTLQIDSYTISYLDVGESLAARQQPAAPRADSPTGNIIRPAGKYYGLLIGVSDYTENRLDLERPANDALYLKKVLLDHYTFSDSTLKVLINPTRQNILVALYNLRKTITPQDNLLIFYAGHGYWDEDARQGYWWAKDATANDPTNWLSNSDVREQIRSIKSAHTLLISDACFSGGIFRSRSAAALQNASLDIQVLYKLPSRRAITSGTMTTVPDKSVFFEYLTKKLVENQEAFITSQQLFDSFRQAVINNSMVVPQDGVIAESGDEGGDFVFIRRNK
jgi:hypothetical protein